MKKSVLIFFLFALANSVFAQNQTYSTLTLTNTMDQLKFEMASENRYWFMSKPSSGYAYALYSPDDGGWLTTWATGSGNMVMHKGKLGVGTSNPQAKLHVNGTTKFDGSANLGTNQLQFLSASGGSNRIYSLGGTSVGSWYLKSRFDNIIFSSGENDQNKRKIIFQSGNTEAMRINTNGNVGIGTSTIDEKLTVAGTVCNTPQK